MLALGFVLASPGPAGALSLLPGETLVLPFSFSEPPVAITGDVDVVVFDVTLGPSSGLQGFTVELRDGATLLGSQTTGVQQLWAFTSPGSSFTLNAAPADLDPVRDATIDGSIRLTPHFDALAVAPGAQLSFPTLSVGRGGSSSSSLVDAEPAPTVGLARVEVAEPASGALVVLSWGLGAWAARRRGRR
jgi:hypothetical protein